MESNLLLKYKLDKQTSTYRVLLAILAIFALVLSHLLANLIIPLILAIFVAYLLNPFVVKLEKKGFNSVLANAIPIISILVLLTLTIYLIYLSINEFASDQARLSAYYEKLKSMYISVEKTLIEYNVIKAEDSFNLMDRILEELKTYALRFISSTTSFLNYFSLFILYLLFLLPGIKNFRVKVNRAFDKKKAKKINAVNEKIITEIQQYIKAKNFISMITGVWVILVCLIFGLDMPIVWGVLAYLLNFIPSLGSILASILPIALSIVQFNSAFQIIGLSAMISGGQFFFGNILEPRLMARTFSLSPFVVIISLFFWGYLWGLSGIILSVPIMAVISIICQNIKPLRPFGLFLQSAQPIRADIEKLSVIKHIAYADKELHPEEEEHIKMELKKEIYNSAYVHKSWEKIIQNPIPLEGIFTDKEDTEKIEFYRLACFMALLDEKLVDEEKELLEQIQNLADIAPLAAENIHRLVCIERKLPFGEEGINFPIAEGLSNSDKEIQIAHSYYMLARKFFYSKSFDKALNNYQKALQHYMILDSREEIIKCSQMIMSIKNGLSDMTMITS